MSNWGQGSVNNTIDWGQGKINNTIDWGSVYGVSESGDTDIIGLSIFAKNYAIRVLADGGTIDKLTCVNNAVDNSLNWAYYFRVTNDGGIIDTSTLECIIF